MRVKMGAIVTDASGKVGGHIMKKNRSGHNLITRQQKRNKFNLNARKARSKLFYFQNEWKGFDQTNKNAWHSEAEKVPFTNAVGDVVRLSGYNLYLKRNHFASLGGFDLVRFPDPGQPLGEIQEDLFRFSTNPERMLLFYFIRQFFQPLQFLLWATPVIYSPRKFVQSDYHFIGTTPLINNSAGRDFKNFYKNYFDYFPLEGGFSLRISYVNYTGKVGHIGTYSFRDIHP